MVADAAAPPIVNRHKDSVGPWSHRMIPEVKQINVELG
jgi:hypothetical protein